MRILQIMPAPGWRVISCYTDDEGVAFFELPVIGWGLVQSADDVDSEVELLVYYGMTANGGMDALTCSVVDAAAQNEILITLQPGAPDLTEQQKQLWAETLKMKMQIQDKPVKSIKEFVAETLQALAEQPTGQ